MLIFTTFIRRSLALLGGQPSGLRFCSFWSGSILSTWSLQCRILTTFFILNASLIICCWSADAIDLITQYAVCTFLTLSLLLLWPFLFHLAFKIIKRSSTLLLFPQVHHTLKSGSAHPAPHQNSLSNSLRKCSVYQAIGRQGEFKSKQMSETQSSVYKKKPVWQSNKCKLGKKRGKQFRAADNEDKRDRKRKLIVLHLPSFRSPLIIAISLALIFLCISAKV